LIPSRGLSQISKNHREPSVVSSGLLCRLWMDTHISFHVCVRIFSVLQLLDWLAPSLTSLNQLNMIPNCSCSDEATKVYVVGMSFPTSRLKIPFASVGVSWSVANEIAFDDILLKNSQCQPKTRDADGNLSSSSTLASETWLQIILNVELGDEMWHWRPVGVRAF